MGLARLEFAAAGLCVGLAACSLMTSLDGLTGGADAPQSLADGADAFDESVREGRSDVDGGLSDLDGGGGSDATDAQLDGGACDATFCDDFERATLQGPWSEAIVASDGDLVLVAVDGGAGRVLAARRVAGSVSSGPQAFLSKDLGTASRVRYAFDLHVVGTVPSYATMASIEVDQGGGRFGSAVVQRGSGASVAAYSNYVWADGGSGYAGASFSTPFVIGAWQRVEIFLQLSPTRPSRYTVKLNGVTVVDKPTFGDLTGPARVGVRAGLWTAAGVADDFRVLVDNVVVDVTP